MVSVEATAYMIAEGLAARWKARKAKRSRAAAKKAAAAGPNPNSNPNPTKKPARASGAQVAPAAALEMVPATVPAGADADADAAKPKAAPAIDVAADVPGGERKLTPRGAGGDVEAPALGSQARPAKARAYAVCSNRGLLGKRTCWHVLQHTALGCEVTTKDLVRASTLGAPHMHAAHCRKSRRVGINLAERARWTQQTCTAAHCCKVPGVPASC